MATQVQSNGYTPPAMTVLEHPASATVEAYDGSGRRWLLTTRAATTGELLTRLPVLTGWLDDHGWQARTPGKASQDAGVQSEPAPTCDRCGQVMVKKQRRDGTGSFWSCQTRFGSEWCKGKPKVGQP